MKNVLMKLAVIGKRFNKKKSTYHCKLTHVLGGEQMVKYCDYTREDWV